MSKISILPASRLRNFAALVTSELGVRVHLRGKSIQVRLTKPPVIFLPDMDGARDSELLPIYGFCLHEAGHIRYTNRKVCSDTPNYLVKLVHNAVEDEFIERMLERDFPGAREMLTRAYMEGIQAVFGDEPIVETTSWLSDDRRADVITEMTELGLDATDAILIEDVSKRLEILRIAKLWIVEQRKYPLPLYDWPTHPWHSVFEEDTRPRARNTQQAFEQAMRIINRLGVKPCLPGDTRPIEDARAKSEEASRRERAAKEAIKSLSKAKRERSADIRERLERSDEQRALIDARKTLRSATVVAGDAKRNHAMASERLKKAETAGTRLRERLESSRRALANLTRRVADASGEEKERLLKKATKHAERIQRLEADLERHNLRVNALRDEEQKADATSAATEEFLEHAKAAESTARKAYVEMARSIRNEVRTKHAAIIDPLAADSATKATAAKHAVSEAKTANEEIGRKDSETEEQVAPGAVEKAVAIIWERFRNESPDEELTKILSGECGDDVASKEKTSNARRIVGAALAGPSRKYCVLDRSFDQVDQVAKTPEAQTKFEQARIEYAGLIREMADRLRKIQSPTQNRLQLNVESGRLDPRKASRVGLGLRGIPIDLSKVWRTTTKKDDPKFAVSLLIDCSGSMSSSVGGGMETHISVARKTAAALSEVLRSIGISHEILGHTTQTDQVRSLIKSAEISATDVGAFSRVVPFQGLIFKGFNENAVPAAVFTDVSLQDNLDGEAVLWAAQRLSARREKTKLLISISDGMPQAHMANTAELERHLLTVCKSIEAKEHEGMILFGIGIGEKRVRQFYKNAELLDSVGDLPRAVFAIVERVADDRRTLAFLAVRA
ncbi:MAG: hypothetical protein WCT04_17100 [Planctomycetota bacterium]